MLAFDLTKFGPDFREPLFFFEGRDGSLLPWFGDCGLHENDSCTAEEHCVV
jgi:hypothetical protein